jgi:large subunit ribosomal protein L23
MKPDVSKQLLIHPLITEKAVNLIEKENTITFIVEKHASKPQIKEEFEQRFNVKVDAVRTLNDTKGRKKALIKLNSKFKASDIAMKLGVI